jgi:6-phosphogluconolactonase
MAERPRVCSSPDPVAEGGRLLAEALRALEPTQGSPRLAVPGGSAARALGPARAQLGAAWHCVRLTWVDERCVPFANPESNRGSAYRAGILDPAHPPASELSLFLDGESGAQAVARVDSALDAGFDGGLDVLLLGMGEDGHVASLFPGQVTPAGARVAFVEAGAKPPPRRITLTRATLESARTTVLFAVGEAKRAVLGRLVAGDPALPAHGLPGLVVVTDLELGGTT